MTSQPGRPAGRFSLTLAAALAVVVGSAALGGCATVLIGGAMVGGTMMAIDRRTSGAQVEDQAIELKAAARVRDLGLDGRVSITSYNRVVLITGEVTRDADRREVERVVKGVDAVRSVVNDLALMAPIGLGERTGDSVITTKVKAAFIDAKDLQTQAAKVVTERGIVYLMGRVTEREATRYAEVAGSVSGVQKVVRVFEVLTEAELAEIEARPPQK
jgi:osmotically-inducible protein OsmY